MADIGEKIFEAFDIIIQERLSGLHFDKTITGVIESIEGIAEEGKENKYIVNDSSTKYTVYSNNVYKVDTSVYVSIPNGDYTQKKFIVGYNLGQDDVKSSTLETDTFIDLTGAVWESVNETTLLANNPAILSKDIIWTTAPGIGTEDSINYNKAPMGYSRMRLSAEISTLFGTKPVQGRYGIWGAVYGLDPKGTPVTSPVEFSTEEGWFGDYYNFDGWWPQEIIFELKDKINTILDIKLSFYQIYDNENKEEKFLSASGKQLAYSADGELFDDNLKVRNIQISFGYSENELSGKNNLMIYAKQDENSRGQVYFSDTDGFRNPIAKARLVHFNEELQAFKEYNTWDEAKTLFETKDVVPLGITYPRIEWYVNRTATVGKDVKDILSNPNLEKINKTVVEDEKTKDIYAFEIALSEAIEQTKTAHDFKAALQYLDMEKLKESFPKEGFSEEDLQNYFDGNLTDKNKEAIAKALITQNSITAQSDFIKYTDEATKDAAAIVDKATAVYLAHVGDKDQYKGRYNIYHNGVLKNDADKGISRVVEPRFKNNKYKIKADCLVEWTVPFGQSTMIDTSNYKITEENDKEKYPRVEENKENGYKIIKLKASTLKDENGKIDVKSYQLIYTIKDKYTPVADTNNIIKCKVTLEDGTEFDEVSQEIFFGTTGAVGTNYGIEIKLEREYTLDTDKKEFTPWHDDSIRHAIPASLATAGKKNDKGEDIIYDNWIKVTAELHHATKIISTQPTFTWEWLDKDAAELKLYSDEETKIITNIPSTENYIRWEKDKNVSTKSILKVSCTAGNLDIVEYFPVPSKLSSGVDYLNCSNKIVYNSNGVLKQYYSDNLSLDTNKTYNNISFTSLNTKELDVNNDKKLIGPPKIYTDNLSSIQCIQAKSGNAVLWSQPIYLYQDRWPSEVLNEWDGDLTINENNGTILSAMMAAGSKNNENAFTGVVMGKVELENKDYEGLFGFDQGEQSFGFKTDGTAFIGKASSGGQIGFDGTQAIIKSENYNGNVNDPNVKTTEGMAIYLAKGIIDSKNFKLDETTALKEGNIAGWNFSQHELYCTTKDANNNDKRLSLFSSDQLTATEVAGSGAKTNWRILLGTEFGITSEGEVYGTQITTGTANATVASRLSTLENRASAIENLTADSNPNESGNQNSYLYQTLVKEKYNGTNNLTLLGRIKSLEENLGTKPGNVSKSIYQRVSDLEKFIGEKDEADKNEKTLYQRVVDLENTVADIKVWKESYKAESIAWITGFTPETETITVPDGDGTKEITIITGITPITTDITVLMEK